MVLLQDMPGSWKLILARKERCERCSWVGIYTVCTPHFAQLLSVTRSNSKRTLFSSPNNSFAAGICAVVLPSQRVDVVQRALVSHSGRSDDVNYADQHNLEGTAFIHDPNGKSIKKEKRRMGRCDVNMLDIKMRDALFLPWPRVALELNLGSVIVRVKRDMYKWVLLPGLSLRFQVRTWYLEPLLLHQASNYAFSIFLVALSIQSFVYNLCANWKFQGSGFESLPSGVVFTKTDLRWNVAICAASSVLTSIEKRPSDGR